MGRVALCKAVCGQCDLEFSSPHLGDFAYGEFVFSTMTGSAHALFAAIGHPVWLRLDKLCTELSIDSAEILPELCAKAADPIDGERLVAGTICPRCHGRPSSWGGDITGFVEVPEPAFERFQALSRSEHVEWLRKNV